MTAALVKKGFTVNIESGAGVEARFRNDDYAAAGGKLTDKNTAFKSGNVHETVTEKITLRIICVVRHCFESETTFGI